MTGIRKRCLALFDHISVCMEPVIPILLAGGICKMLVLVLTTFSVLSGTTETILSAIATAPFYFLPVLVAYSSAKHFDTDPLLAIISVCVTLLPDFSELMESGERVTFAGIPVIPATYAYSVIPIILLIYCMSLIMKGLKRLIRENLQPYLLAVSVLLSTVLLGILLIEPLVSLLSNALADILNRMQTEAPVLAWGLFGALTLMLISTGMHWIFMTMALTQIGLTGVDYGILAALFASNMSLAGCDLGVFVRTKQRDKKTMTLSAMATVLITGIAEPSIFGVCFKEKTPMIGNILGCLAAGIVQGILTVHCYIFTISSIPSILMFYSAEESGNLMKAVIVGAVAFVSSFIVTALVYRDREDTFSGMI